MKQLIFCILGLLAGTYLQSQNFITLEKGKYDYQVKKITLLPDGISFQRKDGTDTSSYFLNYKEISLITLDSGDILSPNEAQLKVGKRPIVGPSKNIFVGLALTDLLTLRLTVFAEFFSRKFPFSVKVPLSISYSSTYNSIEIDETYKYDRGIINFGFGDGSTWMFYNSTILPVSIQFYPGKRTRKVQYYMGLMGTIGFFKFKEIYHYSNKQATFHPGFIAGMGLINGMKIWASPRLCVNVDFNISVDTYHLKGYKQAIWRPNPAFNLGMSYGIK